MLLLTETSCVTGELLLHIRHRSLLYVLWLFLESSVMYILRKLNKSSYITI